MTIGNLGPGAVSGTLASLFREGTMATKKDEAKQDEAKQGEEAKVVAPPAPPEEEAAPEPKQAAKKKDDGPFRVELFYPHVADGLPDRAGFIEREVRAAGYEGAYSARIEGTEGGVKIFVEAA